MDLILDTNFVITTEREIRRNLPGPAHSFLTAHRQDKLYITFTIAGELACGESASPHAEWRRILEDYAVLSWSLEISWQYGEIYRHLAKAGTMIGANDLWIAATALVHGAPLVTNNTREFSRIPGLTVLPF